MTQLDVMQPFFHSKNEKEIINKQDSVLKRKFVFLTLINKKLYFLENLYFFGNNHISKIEYDFQFASQELAKTNEKIEKLSLLSYEEKKQLYYEQLILKFKVEQCEFDIKYGRNSSHNLLQNY